MSEITMNQSNVLIETVSRLEKEIKLLKEEQNEIIVTIKSFTNILNDYDNLTNRLYTLLNKLENEILKK